MLPKKLGQIIIARKMTENNPVHPPSLAERESTLTNTRLDTIWTKLDQQGIKIKTTRYSEVIKNKATPAVMYLENNFKIVLEIHYVEPLQFFAGQTISKYKLYRGSTFIKEAPYVDKLMGMIK